MQAQYDNIGDAIIRGTLVGWLREFDDVSVITGSAPDEYLEVVNLDAGVECYRSLLEYSKSRARTTHLAFAPGEQYLDRGVREWPKAVANILLSYAIRANGGRVVKVGRGYRGAQRFLTLLERVQMGASDLTLVRDVEALRMFPRASLMPDIALASERFDSTDTASAERREGLVLSMRGDRGTDLEYVGKVLQSAGQSVSVVTQVRRDAARSAEVALHFGVDLDRWEGSMEEQLRSLVDRYRSARFVVSDRLHVLIFALLCGAIPLGIETGSHNKLSRQFDAIGLGHLIGSPTSRDLFELAISDPAAVAAETRSAIQASRLKLNQAKADVGSLLARDR
ncbi:polysaccharide pyruvyl transferase family protein [Microbacterium plantarum]|uniref:Polysaccharide pyruvyl transferase family protein n=1 Tax=Microbacterium plantarum TaxID=1816425 RepID=A0ABV5EVV3_9MICO